jgi:hypothetical protein
VWTHHLIYRQRPFERMKYFFFRGVEKKNWCGHCVLHNSYIITRSVREGEKRKKKRNLDTSSMRAYTTTTSRATNLPPPPTHLNQTLNTFSVFFGFNLILFFLFFTFSKLAIFLRLTHDFVLLHLYINKYTTSQRWYFISEKKRKKLKNG